MNENTAIIRQEFAVMTRHIRACVISTPHIVSRHSSGTVGGSLLGGAGDDTISLNTVSSITGIFDGGITTNSLALLRTGIIDHAFLNIETLDVQGDWTLNRATIAAGGTLADTASLVSNLMNNGMISPGNSIGTITIDGDHMQTWMALNERLPGVCWGLRRWGRL